MSKQRTVEVYVGVAYGSGEGGIWNSRYVEIPADTPEEQIERVAVDTWVAENPDEEYAIIGLYSARGDLLDEPDEPEA